jgi:hypothetical protein
VINKGKLVLDDRFDNLKEKMNNRWFEEIFSRQESRRSIPLRRRMIDVLGY